MKMKSENTIPTTRGKCPIDGRENRPVFIIFNNKRTLALSDGLGDAYRVYGEGYDVYNILGVGDSMIRERVFEELSKILGVDYDVIYQKWLNQIII